MRKSSVITARVTPETLSLVDKLAAAMERPRAWILRNAVEDYVERQGRLIGEIQLAEEDVAEGRLLSQEDVEAMFDVQSDSRNAA